MMLLSLSFMMNSIMNVRVGAHSSCPGNTRESKLQPRFSKKKKKNVGLLLGLFHCLFSLSLGVFDTCV